MSPYIQRKDVSSQDILRTNKMGYTQMSAMCLCIMGYTQCIFRKKKTLAGGGETCNQKLTGMFKDVI